MGKVMMSTHRFTVFSYTWEEVETLETDQLPGQEQTALDANIFMQIQNNRKPDQILLVMVNHAESCVETRGLKDLFGVPEIRIGMQEILGSLQEMAAVLSFLLETMSTGQDMGLPYAYQDLFQYGGGTYSLAKEGDYRRLTRVE